MRKSSIKYVFRQTIPGEGNAAHAVRSFGVPIVGRVEYGYITPAFSGSQWWGEFNMGDGKWVKMVENGQKWVTIQMCHIPNA